MSSSPAPLCPRLLAAFQVAASVVVGLVLGVVPRRSAKTPLDLFLMNLMRTGEQTGGAIPLGLMNTDDPAIREKAIFALEALVLRDFAKGVALWLLVGGPTAPATEIPDEVVPEGTTIELLATLIEREGQNPDDPYVLGAAALNRWNTCVAVLSEPQVWQLVRKVVEVLLAKDVISAAQLDDIISQEGLAGLLDDYQDAIADVLAGWYPERPCAVSEVAS
jgi:hypothetical protein